MGHQSCFKKIPFVIMFVEWKCLSNDRKLSKYKINYFSLIKYSTGKWLGYYDKYDLFDFISAWVTK